MNEDAFRRRNIPYRLVGAVRFYDRREIRDLMAYLKLVANPADDEAFRRAVNVPKRGLGDATIALLVERPSDLFDPSFQLTFFSVLSIVLLSVPFMREMQRIGSWRPTRATPYPPTNASHSSSEITSIPRSVAVFSFEPAPGPATTRSVFFETEPETFAPRPSA